MKKDSNTLLQKITYTIILLLALGMLIMAFSSCRTGYGCNGRSKTPSGFRVDKYGYMYGRHMGLTRRERRN